MGTLTHRDLHARLQDEVVSPEEAELITGTVDPWSDHDPLRQERVNELDKFLDEPDDDPQCTNCGAHRSEHGINGPCDGFTTQPGGFTVYTSSDLEEMTYEEKADAFGWDDRDDYDPDEDDPEDEDDDGYRVEDEP